MKRLAWIFDETGTVKRPLRIMIFFSVSLMLLAESIFLYYHNPEGKAWLICIIYELTGYYCPGCGAGRASYALLHGQFYKAFRYNPLLCLLLPWIALYVGICALQWLFKGRETISGKIPIEASYVLLGIVIIYGIIRNIDIYPFTLLAPTSVR